MDDSTYIRTDLLTVIMGLPDDEMRTALAALRLTGGDQHIPSAITVERIAELSGLNYTTTERALRRLIVRRVLWR